jgi:pilus assembly protein CpaD
MLPPLHVLFWLAALIPLVSCTNEVAEWSTVEAPKNVRVDWVRFDHSVAFNGRANGVSEPERRKLAEFVAAVAPRYGDQVVIGTGAAVPAANETAARERVSKVAEQLRSMGLRPVLVANEPNGPAWDGNVQLLVGRYVVTPPRCPDWTKMGKGDPSNRPTSNFGCASATNFGLMVANPGDIVRGRTMGPADGEAASRSIREYRKGEGATSAPSIAPLSVGGGIGGAGGGSQ